MARLRTATLVLAAAAATAAAGLAAADAPPGVSSPRTSEKRRPPPVCTRFASPNGYDGRRGTLAAPLRTVAALVAALGPGQKGCLLSGVFQEDVTFRRGGQPGRSITLRAAPGDHPVLRGRMVILDSANDVVVQGLVLDGRNNQRLPSPTIFGDRIQFLGNDVTNQHTAICFGLGSDRYGMSQDVVIAGNRIHDCGRLPPSNRDHGIYVSYARNVVIRGNLIYGNADRGIQLFPNARNTLIEGNIIDGNGEGILFSGDESHVSSDNVLRYNIISNSTLRYNVESYWPGVVGSGNTVAGNCLWNGAKGNVEPSPKGFTLGENVEVDPGFVDRAARNFALQPGSKCAALLPNAPPQPR